MRLLPVFGSYVPPPRCLWLQAMISLFMWALRWLPPTVTVLYLTLNPIAAMVPGIVVLGESLTAELIAGMALVLLGIVAGSGVRMNWRKVGLRPS